VGRPWDLDRQLAKALNFGLLYGMGFKSFRVYARTQYSVSLTEAEARGYRDSFFRSCPGLANWHRRAGHARPADHAHQRELLVDRSRG
jgi:DNA polymerase I-like protein with 3'-5' exonuclease and polymerase domains